MNTTGLFRTFRPMHSQKRPGNLNRTFIQIHGVWRLFMNGDSQKATRDKWPRLFFRGNSYPLPADNNMSFTGLCSLIV